jgi:hypothetical protein
VNKIVAGILLSIVLASGCVRPSDRVPGPPANVAAATRQAYLAHRQRMADFYEESASHPPKTVSEWAAKSLEVGESSQQKLRADLARFMQPAIGEGNDDKLDPVAAKKLFAEMAKGLRR